MKKLFAIAGVILLTVGITGCAGSSGTHAIDPEPMPTYTVEPDPTPTTPVYTKDEIFVSLVRSQYPYYASLYSDAELVNIGALSCKYFRDGGDFESLAYNLVMSIDSDDPEFFSFIGFTIGSSVATYCPQYSYLVS